MPDRAQEQRPPSTKAVCQEQQEGDARAYLDNAVDTCAEQARRCAGNTQIFEDGRRIRVDSVRARHLLADHEHDGDERAVAIALDCPHLPLQIQRRRVTDHPALVLELVDNLLELFLDIRVRGCEVAQPREHRFGLFPPVLPREPPRRLVAQQHASAQQHGGQRLYRQRENVHGLARHVDRDAVVDPKGNHAARHNEQLVHTRQQPANRPRRVLGHVQRIDGAGRANAEPGNEASDVHGRELAGRGGLQDDADEDQPRIPDQAPFAAELVRERECGNGASEAPSLEHRDDVGREIGFGDGACGA